VVARFSSGVHGEQQVRFGTSAEFGPGERDRCEQAANIE
jgi:hypothetical protein